MSKIVPKLNLNKTPQLVDNNSLVMAKNIRLLEDGTIGPDTSLEEIETNTGVATEHSIEHEPIVQTVTDFFYSILDYKGVIKILKGENPDLDTDCFNFGTDNPDDHWDYYYKFSFPDIYKNLSADRSAFIYCYEYTPIEITWTSDKFRYDIDSNILVNSIGNLFVIAIRIEILTNSPIPDDGRPNFFYTTLPEALLNTYINFNGVTYKVCNPVYQTRSTHDEIIQEAWTEHRTTYDTVEYIAQIVGLDNKIYFFKESNYINFFWRGLSSVRDVIEAKHTTETFIDNPIEGRLQTFDVDSYGYVTRNGELYQDTDIARLFIPQRNNRIKIIEYDEVNKTFNLIKCAWKYNGGKINGCVTTNGTGEPILTICEHDIEDGLLVPIKHINIARCSESDNESIYTQAPDIPITNLLYHSKYSQQIPSGVYQFFIRYEIRENFYTNWFLCSSELFAASRKTINTIQGSIKYVDLHEDSNESFILEVEHLFPSIVSNYKRFQIGFILSHDNGVFARSWKHFPIENSNGNLIYFDYNKDSIENINIDDLLKVNYDLYNVGNVATFKNKLYISNFKETDFNVNDEDLESFAHNIQIDLDFKEIEGAITNTIKGYTVIQDSIEGDDYFVSYYNKQETHELSEVYGNRDWCNVDFHKTSEPEDNRTIREVLYEYIWNGKHWVKRTRHPNILEWLGNRGIYSMYCYDENNNRIDLITSHEDRFDDTHVPNDIYTWDRREGLYPTYVQDHCIDVVRNYIIGIGTDNVFYLQKDNGPIIKADKIYFKEVVTKRLPNEGNDNYPPEGTSTEEPYYCYARVKRTIIECEFTVDNLYDIIINNVMGEKESQTLLPFTNYDFYCHFVKQNGIATNGYKIKSIKLNHWAEWTTDFENPTTPLTQLPSNAVVYPKFTPKKNIPNGYAGYFITMYKHKNDVSEVFCKIVDNGEYRFDCIESDTGLYKVYDKILIKNWKGEIISTDAKYAPSGITNPVDKFGDTGYIYFQSNDTINEDSLWIVGNDYIQENNKELVKVTPIKRLRTPHTILEDEFLQGYLCSVSKLKHNTQNNRMYVSGSDIYELSIDSNHGINLTLDSTKKNIDYSLEFNVHSNYNLNYTSLTQDLVAKLRTYNIEDVSTTNNNTTITVTANQQQIIYSVDSLIASHISILENTFKDYTRKLFYVKEDNKLINFNNVIRCSNVDADEVYRYIYSFEATDYYNVPTQRGIITNLVSIANTLYVHCEHSLFKFTDNKILNGQNEEVTLQENDIFNSGISEVFDAQFGYAGLKNREQSLVTYNAYVFYDEVAKIIYAFGGEQQIGNISEPIKKLIQAINPTDVQFVGDELHNRFFVNLINESGNVCLSFNFGSKSFIAVHDITFKFGFHSRKHTYFVHDNMYNGDKIGWSIYRITDTIDGNFIAYQNCYEPSLIQIADCDNVLLNPVKSVNACVDIIINTEYEKIKQLDYISWICSEILEYGNNENLVAEEVLNRKYPGTKLRIYSDSTQSDLFELLKSDGNAKISNEERNVNGNDEPNPNPNSWQYPQYNCGVWSMNYFRDVLNTGDIFHYKASKNKITGGSGHSKTTDLTPKVQRENLTQESSLIYGKYFVLRFIFNNKNFKLENVMLKMNDYGKTK